MLRIVNPLPFDIKYGHVFTDLLPPPEQLLEPRRLARLPVFAYIPLHLFLILYGLGEQRVDQGVLPWLGLLVLGEGALRQRTIEE